jgi:hypothetical protein
MLIELDTPMKTFWITLILLPLSAWAQYPIGHRNVTYIDSARSNRQVPADVYYPATLAGDNTPVASPPAGGFPVISFGHGFLLTVATYQYLWEALVPEGYIVALPRTESNFSPSHQQFGLDLAFLIEQLRREGNATNSPFFGAVGASSCVMGHSMGGGASFLAVQSDTTISTIANLAAAETNPSAIAAAGTLSLPSLLFSGSEDCVAPAESHQLPMYNALHSECKTYISVTGGSHCKFGENNFTCNLGELSCPGSLSREAQHQIVLFHLLPFLDYHLKGSFEARCVFQERLATGDAVTYQQVCLPPSVQDLTIYPSVIGIVLRWSNIPEACAYELLRSNQSSFVYDTLLRIYQGTATAFGDTTLSQQSYYGIWVK